MQRNTRVGLTASTVLHVAALAGLGGFASSQWTSPIVAVNRGVITLTASLATVDPSEVAADFHVHAPGIPHDHEHPDTPFAAHSHPVRKTPTDSVKSHRDVNVDLDAVRAEQGQLPVRASSARAEEVPAASEPVASPPQRIPRQSSRVTPLSTPVEAVTVPRIAAAAPGANVDRLPERHANNPVPPYPEQAYAEGRQGRVVLEVQLDETGSVKTLRVAESSGYDPFDDSALATVRKWRFTPARRGDKAVPYTIRVPVRFAIRTE
jgi:TonB family protein